MSKLADELREFKFNEHKRELKRRPVCTCDNCATHFYQFSIRNPVYQCVDCPDYILCEKCYLDDTVIHEHSREEWFEKVTEDPYQLFELLIEQSTYLSDVFRNAFSLFSSRPLFGTFHSDEKSGTMELKWRKFWEIGEESLNVGHGLRELGLAQPRDNIAICSSAKPEFFSTFIAGIYQSMVLVPIDKDADLETRRYILNLAKIKLVVCEAKQVDVFLKLARTDCKDLRAIVVMDSLKCDTGDSSVSLYDFQTVVEHGKRNNSYGILQSKPDELALILFTSGSTGVPKGVMNSYELCRTSLIDYSMYQPHVTHMFLSLAHASGLFQSLMALTTGGRVTLSNGDLAHLIDEIRLTRPTTLSSTPRLWNHIFKQYQSDLSHCSTEEAKTKLLEQYSQILGGRQQALGTGGAPTSSDVLYFLRECFKCEVHDGYGTSETGDIYVREYKSNSEYIVDRVQVKLVSCPELGYTTEDKPYPRGEVYVKSTSMMSGYYNNEQLTQDSFEDGWYKTGDIGEELGPRKIRLIDRKKNVFKLSQGEFVCAERLENMYLRSPWISQICIVGDTEEDSVVAIVVPNQKLLEEWFIKENVQDVEDAAENPELQNLLLAQMTEVAKQHELRSFEIPCGVLVELEPFTVQNGKLTPSLKIKRPAFSSPKYAQKLRNVYSRSADRLNSIKQKLVEVMGLATSNSKDQLGALGIDSISAVRISHILKEKYSIDVSLSSVLEGSIESIAREITSGSLSSTNVNWKEEACLQYEKSGCSSSIKQLSATLPTIQKQDVLLMTGCTGFIGVQFLHELLQDSTVQRVYCLIRSKSTSDALTKLQIAMSHLWNEKYLDRLKIVLGDLEQPLLGLADDSYTELVECVDVIYHNGAHVNSMYSYQHLYPANVGSTVELMKLASTHHMKPIHYTSTAGIFSPLQGVVSENYQVESMSDEQLNSMGGYSQSKWVSECILRQAAKDGLPLTIFRPVLVAGNTDTGVSNRQDWAIRLLTGILEIGKYPLHSTAALDWVPVDFLSKAIVHITRNQYSKAVELMSFTLNHPKGPLSFNKLMQMITRHRNLVPMQYDRWIETLKLHLPHSSPLYPLVPTFEEGFPQIFGQLQSHNVQQLLVDSSITCPDWSEQIVQNYLQFITSA